MYVLVRKRTLWRRGQHERLGGRSRGLSPSDDRPSRTAVFVGASLPDVLNLVAICSGEFVHSFARIAICVLNEILVIVIRDRLANFPNIVVSFLEIERDSLFIYLILSALNYYSRLHFVSMILWQMNTNFSEYFFVLNDS